MSSVSRSRIRRANGVPPSISPKTPRRRSERASASPRLQPIELIARNDAFDQAQASEERRRINNRLRAIEFALEEEDRRRARREAELIRYNLRRRRHYNRIYDRKSSPSSRSLASQERESSYLRRNNPYPQAFFEYPVPNKNSPKPEDF